MWCDVRSPAPRSPSAKAVGSSSAWLYSSQRAGAQISAWSREPRTSASPSRPAKPRRFCGTRTRPWRSSSVSKAPANSCRWSSRALGSVMGRLPTFVASSSQAGIGKIARQVSSHLATTQPPASCARKRAGTARRPLSSTACRYSPVNTASRLSLTSDGAWVGRSTRGPLRRHLRLIPHFPPLCATSGHHSAPECPRQCVFCNWGSGGVGAPRSLSARGPGRGHRPTAGPSVAAACRPGAVPPW